jgi:signal transduction histidine kinase
MVINWLQRHPRLTDAILVVIALATVGGAAFHEDRRGLGIPIALVTALPLLWRRQRPYAVLVITTTATALALVVWGFYNPFPVGLALFTVAELSERRASLLAGITALAVLTLPLWHSVGWSRPLLFLGRMLGFAVAWLIGDSIGTRRRYVDALEERAKRLERERAAEAARAVAEEQARIARELHDVIAHNLSVMVVQAAAADDVFDARPDRARDAIRNIEQTGRGALDELRQLLGDVRGEPAVYAPQPGLALVEELAAQVRGAGLDVDVTIEGTPRRLPAALDLSAYRVIQEALTNTLKHARATRAEVVVRYRDGELDLLVRDDGIGSGAPSGNGAGHGLIGMRERLNVFGGSLEAGPDDGGGFVVSARFPLGAAT